MQKTRVTPRELSKAIKRRAFELGFDLVGVAPADAPPHAEFFLDWLERGHAGEMAYLSRDDTVKRRVDPGAVLPGARSIVVVAINYNDDDDGPIRLPMRPVIARYARGEDYHRVLEDKLAALEISLNELTGSPVKTKAYVDYGPVLERDHAQRAGLGWIGKNTMLINPEIGSYLFLGVIVTDVELALDEPFLPDRCGTCTRCIVACPTGAIVDERVVDSRLCISYLTIELRGPIPRELRPLIGNRIFGCDICQEVCPWNDEAPRAREPRLRPRDDVAGAELVELMTLSEDEFERRFGDTPLERTGRRGLLRNVAVALGNWGDPAAVPVLARGLADDDPLVRGHAAWALGRIGTPEAITILSLRLTVEPDPSVREEIAHALF